MFDPTAMILADRAVRHHVTSAGPTAPMAPERPPGRSPAREARQLTATVLRRLADRVEPACQPTA
jgi:hypothetical protein